MNKVHGQRRLIVKRWAVVTTILVLISLLVGAAAWRSLDPASLKKKLITMVKEETGLNLSIEGNVDLSLLPLGIDLGRIELENTPGFTASFLLRSDSVMVRIKLLPLLRRQIDMQTLTVNGLELNLERDRYGRTNWSKVVAETTPSAATPPAVALAIGGVSIQDASLRFSDQRTRTQFALDDIDFTTGALTTGEAADIHTTFRFTGERQSNFDAMSITGGARVDGKLSVDLGTRTARIAELQLVTTATSDQLTEGEARLSVRGGVDYALRDQTLSFEQLAVDAEGFKLAGVAGDVRLESPAMMVNLDTGLVQIKALDLHTNLRGTLVPGGAMNVALGGDLVFNRTTQVLVAENLHIDIPRLVWSDALVSVVFAGNANADLAKNILSVPNLDLKTTLAGQAFAGESIEARLRTNLRVDVWRSGLVLRDIRLDALDMQATGNVAVTELLRRPTLDGTVRIDPFNPRSVLEQLGYAPLDTRDPAAFTAAQLSARVAGSRDGVELTELELEIDDTRLTGSIAAKHFGHPKLRVDLLADEIDADRYRSATRDALRTVGAGPAVGAIAAVPIERLRALDVVVHLQLDRLHAGGLSFSTVDVGLEANEGLIMLTPFSGALYDGRYWGQVSIDARTVEPTLSIDEQMTGLNLAGLMGAWGLEPRPPVSDATADLQLKLNATSDASGERLKIESLKIDGNLTSTDLEQGALALGLRGSGYLSVPDARLDLKQVRLALDNVNAAGQLSIEDATGDPRFTGEVVIDAFDPRSLVASLGLPALRTADPKAFRSLALSTAFDASANRLRLDDLVITLDDTRANGHVDVTHFGTLPSVRFELAVGNVNADRYLPPPSQPEQAESGMGAWPLAALRTLDVDGLITAKQMRLTDVQLSNVKLRVTASDGELRVQPPEPEEQVDLERPSEGACIDRDARYATPSCALPTETAGSQHGDRAPSTLQAHATR